MRILLPCSVAAFFVVFCASAQSQTDRSTVPPSRSWATKVSDVPEIPTLYLVAPNFYRSAQPTSEGFRALVTRKNVRTVISLRVFHSDEHLTGRLPIRGYRFPVQVWDIDEKVLIETLRVLRRAVLQGPTLLHCDYGTERTGLITALYRMAYQGWSKEAALAEMEHGHFGLHDLWPAIPAYVRRIDVPALRHAAALH
jgi:protein tyrosine/serine phosphatase